MERRNSLWGILLAGGFIEILFGLGAWFLGSELRAWDNYSGGIHLQRMGGSIAGMGGLAFLAGLLGGALRWSKSDRG